MRDSEPTVEAELPVTTIEVPERGSLIVPAGLPPTLCRHLAGLQFPAGTPFPARLVDVTRVPCPAAAPDAPHAAQSIRFALASAGTARGVSCTDCGETAFELNDAPPSPAINEVTATGAPEGLRAMVLLLRGGALARLRCPDHPETGHRLRLLMEGKAAWRVDVEEACCNGLLELATQVARSG